MKINDKEFVMILSGIGIRNAIESESWKCNKTAQELRFGPNSVDVTLSPYFLTTKNRSTTEPIDLENIDSRELFEEVYNEKFILYPNCLVLGSVNEKFDCAEPLLLNDKTKKFVQHYEGRSTLGRMGIQSHVTAGFGDYGFKGSFTLELINNSPWPIIMKKGMRIGQVYFESLVGETKLYEGYDQTDCKPQYPRLGKNRF